MRGRYVNHLVETETETRNTIRLLGSKITEFRNVPTLYKRTSLEVRRMILGRGSRVFRPEDRVSLLVLFVYK